MQADVKVTDFADRVVEGDWSAAVQAAFDQVSVSNGYTRGATIGFPPGVYRIDRTVKLGMNAGNYGVRLSGYGASLLGSAALDQQPLDYEMRKAALEEKQDKFSLMALPGELDFEGKNVGPAILELWRPVGGPEGASYVIEGLTFEREKRGQGVGIKVPAETVPKNITFRDIKVHGQNVGVHINHCYQVRFESCVIRGNQIGIWGRNHFNSVSIINSSIRRQHLHGIVIGPNAGSWGSSAVYIAGCVFEETKGYGILNAGGLQVAIVNNYFEMVGNSVGALSPYGNTTIECNHFWGKGYGHGWKMNRVRDELVSDRGHVVVNTSGVQLRNNRYNGAPPILVFGLGGQNSFDAQPVVAAKHTLDAGTMVADSSGFGAYVFDARGTQFVHRAWQLAPAAGESAAVAKPAATGAPARPTCPVCGQVYDAAKGDPGREIPPGTPFAALPADWTCPACNAKRAGFLLPAAAN